LQQNGGANSLNMSQTNNLVYFNSLTGVRFLAASMVYFHHFIPVSDQHFLYYIFNELHIGVTLFFVLSGFLIAYRYLDLQGFSFRNYMVNRIARIYPMYFLLTTLTFSGILIHNFNSYQWLMYGLNVTMLRGFFADFRCTGIAQGWSLTVEETFYFLAPLFFFVLRKSKAALLWLPLVLISTGVGLVLFFSKHTFLSFFSSFEFMFNYTFFGRCSEFFIGIALALAYKNNVIVLKRFRHFTYVGIAAILFSLFLLNELRGTLDFGIRQPWGKVVNTLFLPLFGIFPLYYGLLTESTWISKILGSKPFVLLGKSSYIFYLIHMGVVASFLQELGLSGGFLMGTLHFVLLNALSIALFWFVEDPLNALIRKHFTRRQLPS